MSRNTVNGIKVKDVDDKTRHQILRAGDIEAQILKAAELKVLDTKHYDKVIRGLKKDPRFRQLITLVSCYMIYGFSLVRIGKFVVLGLL